MPDTQEKQPRSLLDSRIGLAEHKHTIFFVVPEDGVTEDDILNPEFWAHVSQRMKPCDEIKVYSEDGRTRWHLHVAASGRNWAKVHLLTKHEFKSATLDDLADDGLAVKYRNPHSRYAVIKKASGEVIKDRFDTEDQAATYLREHRKTLAA